MRLGDLTEQHSAYVPWRPQAFTEVYGTKPICSTFSFKWIDVMRKRRRTIAAIELAALVFSCGSASSLAFADLQHPAQSEDERARDVLSGCREALSQTS